jgi:hypothetical protein
MTEPELQERIELFRSNRQINPVIFNEEGVFVLSLYKVQRESPLFKKGEKNTIDSVSQRDDFFETVIFTENELDALEKYISFENFTLKKEIRDFAELQDVKKKNLSLTQNIPNDFNIDEVSFMDIKKYQNYLDHLAHVKMIKTKTSKIVKDKFDVINSANVNTSAIFSNVGYIVKGFEGKYIDLSKGDRTFIKNFMDDQIKSGAYKITMKETLPLYKESIKEIITIGNGLLELTNNKIKIRSFSRNILGTERKTLESCWQLYFEKYLRVMLMHYKEFYSQFIFKEMKGYEKESRPDFLAVDLYNNIDIIEIKTHRTILFRKEQGRDSYYPSHELNKSIFQLNKYMDLRSANIDTSKIDNKYTKSLIENEKIYRPRGILIISSQDHITSEKIDEDILVRLEKELKKLKTTYNNIDIILFDELLKNLENYVSYLEISLEK